MKKPAPTAAYQATISSWSIDRTVMGTAGTIRGPWTARQPGQRYTPTHASFQRWTSAISRFPAENGQRRGRERESATLDGRQVEPPRREDPQHVAVREAQDVARRGQEPAR